MLFGLFINIFRPDGIQFLVKAKDNEKQQQEYKEGDLVTFSYEGVSR